jgi:hypothetical protein
MSMYFTLTQWLTLAAVIVIPFGVSWLVTKGTFALVDWQERRDRREIDKVLELEDK